MFNSLKHHKFRTKDHYQRLFGAGVGFEPYKLWRYRHVTGFFSPNPFFCFKLFLTLQTHFAEGENFLVNIVFVMENFISTI